MVRKTFYLPDEMYARLKEFAASKGMSISATVRMFVEEALKRRSLDLSK